MASDRARDAPSPVQERTVGTPTARSESLQQRLMNISPYDIGLPSASQPDQLMGQSSPYGGLGWLRHPLEHDVVLRRGEHPRHRLATPMASTKGSRLLPRSKIRACRSQSSKTRSSRTHCPPGTCTNRQARVLTPMSPRSLKISK